MNKAIVHIGSNKVELSDDFVTNMYKLSVRDLTSGMVVTYCISKASADEIAMTQGVKSFLDMAKVLYDIHHTGFDQYMSKNQNKTMKPIYKHKKYFTNIDDERDYFSESIHSNTTHSSVSLATENKKLKEENAELREEIETMKKEMKELMEMMEQ